MSQASSSPLRGRWILILLALLLMSAAAGIAVAKHGDRPGFLPPAGYLDLNEQQAATAEAILRGVKEANKPLRQESRQLKSSLRELLDAQPQDALAIGETAIAIHALREQIRAARDAANTEIEAILDEQQLVKWQNFRELHLLSRHP